MTTPLPLEAAGYEPSRITWDYEIWHSPAGEPAAILCKKCCLVSFHPKDVEQRYCGACDRFHEDTKL